MTLCTSPGKTVPITASNDGRPLAWPPTTEQDWHGAVRGKFYRPIKQQLTVRIDADVLEWLKSHGKGYQSRLNKILRAAMLDKVSRR